MRNRLHLNIFFVLLSLFSLGTAARVATTTAATSPPLPRHYPVAADPQVPVPGINPPLPSYAGPTRVELFPWTNFTNYAPNPFNYTPSSSSPDAWAKIVVELECKVTKGRQFDRTAFLSIGNSTLFIGTTAEPTAHHGPQWNVTSDVTRYAALLSSTGGKGKNIIIPGQIYLAAIVDSTYNGVPMCKGAIAFYPVDTAQGITAPTEGVPIMAGLGSFTTSGNFTVKAGSELTKYGGGVMFIDLFIQNQGGDEFFWSCLPNNYSGLVGTCGNGALRFGEVLIDGELVGLAPAYPYIFTGGIDPGLWNPIPSSRTLNLVPLRVDLTYFVGMFTDGKDHNITLQVVGGPSPSGEPGPTNSFWNLAGTLFYYPNPDIDSTKIIKNNLRSAVKAALSRPGSVKSTLVVSGKDNSTVRGSVSQSFVIPSSSTTADDEIVAAEVTMKGPKKKSIGYSLSVVWSNQQFYNMTNNYSISVTNTAGNWKTKFYSDSVQVSDSSSLLWELGVDQDATPDPHNSSLTLQRTNVTEQYLGMEPVDSTSKTYSNTIYSTDTMVIDQKESYVLNFTNQYSQQGNEEDLNSHANSGKGFYYRVLQAKKNKIFIDVPPPQNQLDWKIEPLVLYQGHFPFANLTGGSSFSSRRLNGLVVEDGLSSKMTPGQFLLEKEFVQNPRKFGKQSLRNKDRGGQEQEKEKPLQRSIFVKNIEGSL